MDKIPSNIVLAASNIVQALNVIGKDISSEEKKMLFGLIKNDMDKAGETLLRELVLSKIHFSNLVESDQFSMLFPSQRRIVMKKLISDMVDSEVLEFVEDASNILSISLLPSLIKKIASRLGTISLKSLISALIEKV